MNNTQEQNYDNGETALISTKDFHHQYNRFEDVVNFKMKKVSRKLMEDGGRANNQRLNQIYQKFTDPQGYETFLKRNQII